MDNKIFTGVGSRKVPDEILELMFNVGRYMAFRERLFRSGFADGSDKTFQEGFMDIGGEMEIYLPWKGFNNAGEDDFFICPHTLDNYWIAIEILQSVLPYYDKLTRGPRALHTRNVYQVLGKRLLRPSDVTVFYAEPKSNGTVSGGTNTAYLLSKKYYVPTFNLYNETVREKMKKIIYDSPIGFKT